MLMFMASMTLVAPAHLSAAETSVSSVSATAIDPPRSSPRFGTSVWGQLVRTASFLKIKSQYGHRAAFTDANIAFFVDWSSDRDWGNFWNAFNNGNHTRARRIFKDFVYTW